MVESSAKLQLSLVLANLAKENLYLRPEMRQLIIFFFLIFSGELQAQSIDSIFVSVPKKYLPLLEEAERLNLLDLYNYKMKAETENSFGGRTLMVEKDSDYVGVQLTEVSSWELKRLYNLVPDAEGNGWEQDPFYAVTHTITAGAKSSRIYFFDAQWHQIYPPFPLVRLDNFWVDNKELSIVRLDELKRILQTPSVYLHWDAKMSVLTYAVSLEALPLDDAKDAATCLHPIRYEWTGQSFVEIP